MVPSSGGSRLELAVEERHYRLRTAALAILLLGAAGTLVATLWPLFPRLLGLVPLGIVLALGAWFLVVSRLRVAGPEEFLQQIERAGSAEPELPGTGAPPDG